MVAAARLPVQPSALPYRLVIYFVAAGGRLADTASDHCGHTPQGPPVRWPLVRTFGSA